MHQRAAQYGDDNIGVFGYGSLLTHPGDDLGSHEIDRIPQRSPWPVEYARSAKGRSGAPTLVIHCAGEPVDGAILVMDVRADSDGKNLAMVREWVRIRENCPPPDCIKVMSLGGLSHVVFVDLPANILGEKLEPDHLADLAIDSVSPAGDRNGIKYLAGNIAKGIRTPLTLSYRDAILRKTGASDLSEAENKARSGDGL